MENFRDLYLEHALKRWVSDRRPPKGLRAHLLRRLNFEALHEQQPDILQAYILPANQVLGWSFAYAFYGVVRAYDAALTGVSVMV